MKYSSFFRLLSLLLTLTLVLQLCPSITFAAEAAEADSAGVETAAGSASSTIVGEITENRAESQKHFRLADGSFIAVEYGLPVHYRTAAGAWADIDNTLTAQKGSAGYSGAADQQPGWYAAENGEMRKIFAADLSSGMIFAAQTGDYGVYLSMAEAGAERAVSAEESAGSSSLSAEHSPAAAQISYPDDPDNGGVAALSLPAQEQMSDLSIMEQVTPARLRSQILYEDVSPGVDLIYTLYGNNIKETIRLRTTQSGYCYSFRLNTEGLTPTLNADGSVSLTNSDNVCVYEVPAPYMTDANGAYSEDVSYSLTQDESGWCLAVTADEDWIQDPQRVFPIDIDPTLVSSIGGSNFVGYNCNQNNTTVSTKGNFACGYNSDHGQMEIYGKFNSLPTIPGGCTITGATVSLWQNDFAISSGSQIVLYMHQILESAAFDSTLTWANRPEIGDVLDYTIANSTLHTYRYWDVTGAVKS